MMNTKALAIPIHISLSRKQKKNPLLAFHIQLTSEPWTSSLRRCD